MLTISERKQLHDRLKLGAPSILGRVKATRPRTAVGLPVPPPCRDDSLPSQRTARVTSFERWQDNLAPARGVFYGVLIGTFLWALVIAAWVWA